MAFVGWNTTEGRLKEGVAMLVLTRKQGEEIRIRDDIIVRVIQLQGRRVRIGIEAPAHVPIVRTPVVLAELPAHGSARPDC